MGSGGTPRLWLAFLVSKLRLEYQSGGKAQKALWGFLSLVTRQRQSPLLSPAHLPPSGWSITRSEHLRSPWVPASCHILWHILGPSRTEGQLPELWKWPWGRNREHWKQPPARPEGGVHPGKEFNGVPVWGFWRLGGGILEEQPETSAAGLRGAG